MNQKEYKKQYNKSQKYKQWFIDNKEKQKEYHHIYNKIWYQKNKEVHDAKNKLWLSNLENKEKRKRYAQKYETNNLPKIKEYRKRYNVSVSGFWNRYKCS